MTRNSGRQIERRLQMLEQQATTAKHRVDIFVSFVGSKDGKPTTNDETDCTGVMTNGILIRRAACEPLADLDNRARALSIGSETAGFVRIWLRQYARTE